MGGVRVPVRDPGDALVLDRRNSGDALPGHRDDAVLLHLEDALGAGVSAVAVWRGCTRAGGDLVCVHDHPDVRREHVRDGAGNEGHPWVGHQLFHLGGRGDGGAVRDARRVAVGHHQRGAAVHFDLGGRGADSDSRPDRGRWMDESEGADCCEHALHRLRPHVVHAGALQEQPHGHQLGRHRLWPGRDYLLRLLDHRLSCSPACALGTQSARGEDGSGARARRSRWQCR